MWTDAHCHPTPGFDIAEARAAGVERLVTVGTDLASSHAVLAVAKANDGVWATAGVHPHDAKDADLGGIEALLAEPEVVAVGECGLDFHYDLSPRHDQRRVFAEQIALALRYGKALVIHTREAWDETFDILTGEGVPERTVFHCFTGGADEARRALDLGAWLSFSGIVSFKAADDVREAAALCPLDRMTVETDSPYLAPVPHRGKQNRPAWVPHVGAAVAAVKDVPVGDVEAATWSGAATLFRLA